MAMLSDIRILDLSWHGPGSFTTSLLAGLGAEVIKVEPVDGSDFTRTFPPFVGGVSIAHLVLDGRKRSLALDVRDPSGQQALRTLSRGVHGVIEGFRPGVAERLGIGPQDLQRENPALTYCHMAGFPSDGPDASTAGHDLNYVADAGVLALSPEGDSLQPLPTQVADHMGAMLAATGLLAGIHAADRTGRGTVFEASLAEAARHTVTLPLAQQLILDESPGPGAHALAGGLACYGVYACRDGGLLTVAALETKFWLRLCDLLGIQHAGDWHMRPERQTELRALLDDRFRQRDRAVWIDVFTGEDVCVAPVRTLSEAARRLRERGDGSIQVVSHPGGGRVEIPGPPLRFPGQAPSGDIATAPTLGQHTAMLLSEAGYSTTEIDDLVRRGIATLG